jgi:hypothetical protein
MGIRSPVRVSIGHKPFSPWSIIDQCIIFSASKIPANVEHSVKVLLGGVGCMFQQLSDCKGNGRSCSNHNVQQGPNHLLKLGAECWVHRRCIGRGVISLRQWHSSRVFIPKSKALQHLLEIGGLVKVYLAAFSLDVHV